MNMQKTIFQLFLKNGIGTEINLWYSIELLKEAVRLNSFVSMYNLSHLYFYEKIQDVDLDVIINLLIQSFNFQPSLDLLSIILFQKCRTTTKITIQKEIEKCEIKNDDVKNQIVNKIYEFIKKNAIEKPFNFNAQYQRHKIIEFIYDYNLNIVTSEAFFNEKENQKRENIDKEFYNGFGIFDIKNHIE